MANIRQKINLHLWTTLTLAFLVLFIIITYLIHSYNTMTMVDQYKTQGELFAEIIKTEKDSPKLKIYFEKLANRDHDVSFIYYSSQGEPILSSDSYQAHVLDVDGLHGTTNWVTLESDQIERLVLPIKSDKELFGYLELQIKTSILHSHLRSLWILLLLFFIVIIFVIIFILSRFSKRFLDPVEEVALTIKEFAKGNFKARTSDEPNGVTNDLNQAVNTLGINMQEILESYETQQDNMTTLIENMGSGVILIDTKGYIKLVNKAFINQFHFQKNLIEKLYHEVLEHDEIVELIKEIFLLENSIRRQMMLIFPIERRHFYVYGAPIMSNQDSLMGIVLVFHDITELKKLEQVRKDFVANVSHELKTPVTSLKGFAETLLDGAMENADIRKKFISIIWKESDRLQSLIQDLLELSKIEQENFHLDIQPVDMQTVLDEVMLLLAQRAKDKEISLSSEIIGHPVIMGDMARLKQIMINLINNSLSYTGHGGNCKVQLEEHDQSVRLTVRDNGIGISKEEIPRIFERFYRVDKARSRNSGGTGLGLAIVKHLVDAHHGNILVESELNKGTILIIEFPKNL